MKNLQVYDDFIQFTTAGLNAGKVGEEIRKAQNGFVASVLRHTLPQDQPCIVTFQSFNNVRPETLTTRLDLRLHIMPLVSYLDQAVAPYLAYRLKVQRPVIESPSKYIIIPGYAFRKEEQ